MSLKENGLPSKQCCQSGCNNAEYGNPDGFPVFLFHGLPGSRLSWGLIPDNPFPSGLQITAPDRPGYGKSDPKPGRTMRNWPEDVAALAEGLNLEQFAVVGVSGGGPGALACAWRIPERLTATKIKKILGVSFLSIIGFILILISLCGCAATNADDLNRQQRISDSPQWNGETFQNTERVPDVEVGSSLKMFWNYFFKKPEGFIPNPQLPAEPFDITRWNGPRELQFAWLGHTTFLIKIDNNVILTDPMFSQRAGTFGWLSPTRYSKTLDSTDNLPVIDVVLITHNHPDHLDEQSILVLISKTKHFIVPLAVGELLIEWGVSHKKITELDWWQKKSIGGLAITAAPAKHTSERGIFDKNKTLWASYGIQGKKQNIYLSGDSGWFSGLHEIGERLGPFDVTFFEIGAYSNLTGQKEVHYTPERAVKAHQTLKGKLMVPSGWGTFDLGLFPWYEPIERFIIAANKADIDYLTPKIGEVINPGQTGGRKKWWKTYINTTQ